MPWLQDPIRVRQFADQMAQRKTQGDGHQHDLGRNHLGLIFRPPQEGLTELVEYDKDGYNERVVHGGFLQTVDWHLT